MLETKLHTIPKQSTHAHTHTNPFTALYFMSYRVFVQCIKTRKHHLPVSREESHLKCAASSNSFVCVERGADVFAKKLADSLFDGGASRGSSNYLHCIDVIPAQLCHKTHTGLSGFFLHIAFKQYTFINSTKLEGRTWLFEGCFQWHLYSHQILRTHVFKLAPVGYK